MRHLLLLLGVVPGLGQAHTGAPLKGAVLLTGFLLSINTYYMVPYWFPEFPHTDLLRAGCVLMAGIFWGFSFLDHYRRLYRDRTEESSGS